MNHKLVDEWFRLGDMDLAVARNCEATMHPKPLEMICFHCQQAVEKYLKGYLAYQTHCFIPKTHKLLELCLLCQAYEPQFGELKRHCATLTSYAVQSRYPGGIEFEEPQMQRALHYAAEIKAFPPLAQLRKEIEDAQ